MGVSMIRVRVTIEFSQIRTILSTKISQVMISAFKDWLLELFGFRLFSHIIVIISVYFESIDIMSGLSSIKALLSV